MEQNRARVRPRLSQQPRSTSTPPTPHLHSFDSVSQNPPPRPFASPAITARSSPILPYHPNHRRRSRWWCVCKSKLPRYRQKGYALAHKPTLPPRGGGRGGGGGGAERGGAREKEREKKTALRAPSGRKRNRSFCLLPLPPLPPSLRPSQLRAALFLARPFVRSLLRPALATAPPRHPLAGPLRAAPAPLRGACPPGGRGAARAAPRRGPAPRQSPARR